MLYFACVPTYLLCVYFVDVLHWNASRFHSIQLNAVQIRYRVCVQTFFYNKIEFKINFGFGFWYPKGIFWKSRKHLHQFIFFHFVNKARAGVGGSLLYKLFGCEKMCERSLSEKMIKWMPSIRQEARFINGKSENVKRGYIENSAPSIKIHFVWRDNQLKDPYNEHLTDKP